MGRREHSSHLKRTYRTHRGGRNAKQQRRHAFAIRLFRFLGPLRRWAGAYPKQATHPGVPPEHHRVPCTLYSPLHCAAAALRLRQVDLRDFNVDEWLNIKPSGTLSEYPSSHCVLNRLSAPCGYSAALRGVHNTCGHAVLVGRLHSARLRSCSPAHAVGPPVYRRRLMPVG